jgi:hypothetical protein
VQQQEVLKFSTRIQKYSGDLVFRVVELMQGNPPGLLPACPSRHKSRFDVRNE